MLVNKGQIGIHFTAGAKGVNNRSGQLWLTLESLVILRMVKINTETNWKQ